MNFRSDSELFKTFHEFILAKEELEDLKQAKKIAFNINGKHPEKNDWKAIQKAWCHFAFIFNSRDFPAFNAALQKVDDFRTGTISYSELKPLLSKSITEVDTYLYTLEVETSEAEGIFSGVFYEAYQNFVRSTSKKNGIFMTSVMKEQSVENFFFKFLTS